MIPLINVSMLVVLTVLFRYWYRLSVVGSTEQRRDAHYWVLTVAAAIVTVLTFCWRDVQQATQSVVERF